jgi:hypothetical protein
MYMFQYELSKLRINVEDFNLYNIKYFQNDKPLHVYMSFTRDIELGTHGKFQMFRVGQNCGAFSKLDAVDPHTCME